VGRELKTFNVSVTTFDGKRHDVEAYEIEDSKTVLLEASIMRLLQEKGISYPIISSVEGFPCTSAFGFGKSAEEGDRITRYVVVATCVRDKIEFGAVGSAGFDNIQSAGIRPYAPEIAEKRARVRAAIRALGLYGWNADVEFDNFDDGENPFDDGQEEANKPGGNASPNEGRQKKQKPDRHISAPPPEKAEKEETAEEEETEDANLGDSWVEGPDDEIPEVNAEEPQESEEQSGSSEEISEVEAKEKPEEVEQTEEKAAPKKGARKPYQRKITAKQKATLIKALADAGFSSDKAVAAFVKVKIGCPDGVDALMSADMKEALPKIDALIAEFKTFLLEKKKSK